jgi:RimJ/RimL family protein N-acetyltransferase
MKNLPNLEGNLVKLGPFTREYISDYHMWLQDPYILRMTESDPNTSLEEVYEMRDDIEKSDDKIHYIIFDKKTNKPIGDIDLRGINIDNGVKSAESAIMIAEPEYRKRGYATDALNLILGLGFKKFGINNVTALVLYSNEPSIGLYKKFCFEEKGRKGNCIQFELRMEKYQQIDLLQPNDL